MRVFDEVAEVADAEGFTPSGYVDACAFEGQVSPPEELTLAPSRAFDFSGLSFQAHVGDDGGDCGDDADWMSKKGKGKDCDWVAKDAGDRCGEKSADKVKAEDACLGACGGCGGLGACDDDAEWYSKKGQDCDSVAKKGKGIGKKGKGKGKKGKCKGKGKGGYGAWSKPRSGKGKGYSRKESAGL